MINNAREDRSFFSVSFSSSSSSFFFLFLFPLFRRVR